MSLLNNKANIITDTSLVILPKWDPNSWFGQLNRTMDIVAWITAEKSQAHDDVMKWKHFPRNWPFVQGIHRSPVNSPHKGQCRVALMFYLICPWINTWVNNCGAGDLRCNRAHYDIIVMRSLEGPPPGGYWVTFWSYGQPLKGLLGKLPGFITCVGQENIPINFDF